MATNTDRPRILIAWSPQASGTESIDVAAWIARTTDVELRVATTLLRPWPSPSIAKMGGKYKKWFKKECNALDKTVTSHLTAAGIPESAFADPVSVLLDGTNEPQLLAQAAKKFNASVIVLGSGSAAPKGRFRAGTTADTLLNSSTTPLGLAPRAPKLSKRGITRINFAYVDEHISDAAIRAAALAENLGAELRILAISPTGLGDALTGKDLHIPTELAHEWRENSFAALDRITDTIHEHHPGITITTDIGSGIGWSGALDAIKWKKGDLLTFASTPTPTLERVLGGSQTAEILKHVQVPVLMLPISNATVL